MSTLYHLDDLPFTPGEYLPHIYGNFRKACANTKIRKSVNNPTQGSLTPPEN